MALHTVAVVAVGARSTAHPYLLLVALAVVGQVVWQLLHQLRGYQTPVAVVEVLKQMAVIQAARLAKMVVIQNVW